MDNGARALAPHSAAFPYPRVAPTRYFPRRWKLHCGYGFAEIYNPVGDKELSFES